MRQGDLADERSNPVRPRPGRAAGRLRRPPAAADADRSCSGSMSTADPRRTRTGRGGVRARQRDPRLPRELEGSSDLPRPRPLHPRHDLRAGRGRRRRADRARVRRRRELGRHRSRRARSRCWRSSPSGCRARATPARSTAPASWRRSWSGCSGSYSAAFERIEQRLEEFDIHAMRGDGDAERGHRAAGRDAPARSATSGGRSQLTAPRSSR